MGLALGLIEHFYPADQKSKARSVTGKLAGIWIKEKAVIGGGIMTIGPEIVIGIMIVISGMTEREINPVAMIPGVVAGRARGQMNVPGIMIVTGTCSMQQLLLHASSPFSFYAGFLFVHVE